MGDVSKTTSHCRAWIAEIEGLQRTSPRRCGREVFTSFIGQLDKEVNFENQKAIYVVRPSKGNISNKNQTKQQNNEVQIVNHCSHPYIRIWRSRLGIQLRDSERRPDADTHPHAAQRLKVYLSVNKEKPRIQTYIAVAHRFAQRPCRNHRSGTLSGTPQCSREHTEVIKLGFTDYAQGETLPRRHEHRYEHYRTVTNPRRAQATLPRD